LRGLGVNPIEYAEQIVTAFSTSRVDDLALLNLAGPIKNLDVIAALLEQIYRVDPSTGARFRFSLHYLGGGWEPTEILLAWLGEPQDLPGETSERTMSVFREVWAISEDNKTLEKLRQDLARKCAIVARRTGHWTGTGRALLGEMASELEKKGFTEADTLRDVMASLQVKKWYPRIFGALAIHAACWAMLIFAYPRFRLVQAIFFWNPWVRRFTGLAYVGFLLAWVPWLRARLFEPFRGSLLADAHPEEFRDEAYFSDLDVRDLLANEVQPIEKAIPEVKGQVLLVGDSGLGKSFFLRHLVGHSQRVVVYLPAQRCASGVLDAIQQKLHGPARDSDYLQQLIYAGAIDVCIDGLNEVSAETRANISAFVEHYFHGNVILATQPMEWTPPATAKKTFELQPLTEKKIRAFLLSRKDVLPEDAALGKAKYEEACREFLR